MQTITCNLSRMKSTGKLTLSKVLSKTNLKVESRKLNYRISKQHKAFFQVLSCMKQKLIWYFDQLINDDDNQEGNTIST